MGDGMAEDGIGDQHILVHKSRILDHTHPKQSNPYRIIPP